MSGIAPNPLNAISKLYLDQVVEKKDDTYLEPDMKKRQANNEKARKDMEKMGTKMKNPHFEEKQQGWDAVNSLSGAYSAVHEGIRDEDPEKGTKERKARLEKKRGMKLDDHPQYTKEELEASGLFTAEEIEEILEKMEYERDKDHPKTTRETKAGDPNQITTREPVKRPSTIKDKKSPKKMYPGKYQDSGGVVLGRKVRVGEALDPVGKEDGDVDNDGDKDSSDKYLLKRRKAIGKAMKKRMSEGKYSSSVRATYGGKTETFPVEVYKKKSKPVQVKTAEGFSNWRGDLTEIMTDTEDEKQIKEKSGIKNKVKINPKLGEAIEEIGGTLLEEIEIDEMDYVIESVYDELIEEGYSQDEVEYGIDTALNTIEEGYYDSAVAASKAAAAKNRGETPKRSMKDRLKSAAKKAIMGTARAAGRAMKAKAKVQAAPGRAKAKVRSIADRVKSAAKAGYAQGRGPVEKKSKTAYRGAGVGRKEKLGEESVSEAVKGQDTESRKEAAAERKRGDKRLSPSKGKGYADQQKQSISYMDKLTKKNKNVVGLVTKEDVEQVDEKINMKKADMGDVVKDFYKSKAPQFKGKSKEKRREMAIAAKLTAERGGKRLGEQQQQDPAQRSMIGKMTQLQMKKQQMDRRKLQMKKRGEIPLNTESAES